MKVLIYLSIFIFTLPLMAREDLYQPSETHRIVLPARYHEFKRQQQEENKLIPEKAKNARSAGAFLSTVVDFHLQRYLKKNPDSQLHKMKNLEQSINNKTRIEAKNFKIQPKLNLTQMKAEVALESMINSKVWLDNNFTTFNAMVEVYKLDQGDVAVEYKSDNEESRTILGYRQAW